MDPRQTFCTIITRSYLPYARVLSNSLRGFQLCVLVADETDPERLPAIHNNTTYHSISTIVDTDLAKNIEKKYAATNTDHFRWSLKPIYILYLLRSFDRVIFIDPDMYFTGDPGQLFKQLNEKDILLAPHYGSIDAWQHEDGLYAMLRNGLYSGGFIGATTAAIPALTWWAEACHYKMEKSKELGLFDDQKYLDLLLVIHERTGLLRHPGANLTNINMPTAKRELVNGELRINQQYEPLFIHFTKDTIENIRNGNDALLQPILEKYQEELKKEGLSGSDSPPRSMFYAVKSKTKLRTRFKQFLFRLAEKL